MYFSNTHSPLYVLFIRQHHQHCILQLLLLQHGDELLFADADPVPVCTVHHVYHCIGVGIVAPPVRSYTSLSSEVPYLELEVFVSHCLHIKPNGGDGSHHLKVPLETILLKVSKVTTRPLQLVVCIRLWSSQRHQDQE